MPGDLDRTDLRDVGDARAETQASEPGRSMHPSGWAVLVLPFGIAQGYLQVAVPYLLRLRGVDMGVIGALVFFANQPHSLKVLWAPVLDVGWPRKNWYVLSVALTGAFLALASFIPPDNRLHLGPFGMLTLYTATLTAAQVAVGTSSAAVLGIIAVVVPDGEKGRASGWQTAGNLAGTATGGAAVVVLVKHAGNVTTAAVLAVACLLCTLPVLFIHEPKIEQRPLLRSALDLAIDLWKTLISRPGWTGMLICLSPVGTGAMSNLFSALALDYSADPVMREKMVVWGTGVLSGLVSAAGALAGGYLSERLNRRLAYVVFGLVTSLCALGMIVGPANPVTFTLGCLAYSFANGLCYAAFYAFVFELAGKGKAAATKLALFVSASNQAINYVTWLDGKSYDWGKALWPTHLWGGRAGMLGMDALSTFVGVAILGVMMVVVRKRGSLSSPGLPG